MRRLGETLACDTSTSLPHQATKYLEAKSRTRNSSEINLKLVHSDPKPRPKPSESPKALPRCRQAQRASSHLDYPGLLPVQRALAILITRVLAVLCPSPRWQKPRPQRSAEAQQVTVVALGGLNRLNLQVVESAESRVGVWILPP